MQTGATKGENEWPNMFQMCTPVVPNVLPEHVYRQTGIKHPSRCVIILR